MHKYKVEYFQSTYDSKGRWNGEIIKEVIVTAKNQKDAEKMFRKSHPHVKPINRGKVSRIKLSIVHQFRHSIDKETQKRASHAKFPTKFMVNISTNNRDYRVYQNKAVRYKYYYILVDYKEVKLSSSKSGLSGNIAFRIK